MVAAVSVRARSDDATCERCGRTPFLGWRYVLSRSPAGAGTTTECLRCALRYPSLVGRAARLALVVGTILTAINQGNGILGGHPTAELLWKIPLTYLVPYAVSTYSSLDALRHS